MIFLRPYWLILLLIPLFFLWLRRKGTLQNPWQPYIDKKLMSYLSVSSKIGGGRIGIQGLLTGIWILMVIALSGPAIDKLPTPTQNTMPATVLIVDLNTLNPEKTTLLHVKLYNLINQLKDNQIGVVLYDTKGYVALPLTRDKEILNTLIPALESSVMPTIGNNVATGFEKALELLQNTGQKTGRILLITGGTPDIEAAQTLMNNTPYQVGILGIGNETTGTPVINKSGTFLRDKNGNLILSKPDKSVLSRLGVYRNATPVGTEIAELIEATKPLDLSFLQKTNDVIPSDIIQADVWRDLGAYITILLLPFMAYLFRKGLFFGFILLITLFSTSSNAGLWLRTDQENYRNLQAGNTAYQQKEYAKALELYSNNDSSDVLYNKANTLAQLGQYQAAIDTYAHIIEKYSDYEDAAYNKKYLEEQLSRQNNNPQNQQSAPQSDSDDSSDRSDSENQENQTHSSDQSDSENQPSSTDANSDDSSDSSDTQDNSQPSENNESSSPKEQQNTTENNSTLSDDTDKSDNSTDKKPPEAPNTPNSSENNSEENTSSQQEQSPNTPDQEQQSTQLPDLKSLTEPTEKSLPESNVGLENPNIPSDMIDQETQQIINRLKKDPSRLLRYRLYRQYKENP